MPRSARAVVDDGFYHVINRGNGRMDLFHKPADFESFLRIVGQAQERYPVDLFSWCLMTNHWHLVLRPRRAEALAEFMRWLGVTHVRRHHEHYHQRGMGHLYQGRFKSFQIQSDEHFLKVCRYVEANPLRAKLVRQAEKWPWSSLGYRPEGTALVTCADWPVDRPTNWADLVNEVLPTETAESIRTSIARDRPYGTATWVTRTINRLGLQSTMRPRGRPRKEK